MGVFLEYLNSKGKMQEKPKVKLVADEVEKGKGDGGAKIPKEARPIKNGKQAQVSEGKKFVKGNPGPKGLGDEGDKKLIFGPCDNPPPAKIPTVETNHYDLFPQVRNTLMANPALVETLIRDLKRNGLLGIVVAELTTHHETFQHLAKLANSKQYGRDLSKKLARVMGEEVAPPFSKLNQDAPLEPGEEESDMDLDNPHGDDAMGDDLGGLEGLGDEDGSLEDMGDEEGMEDPGMGDGMDGEMGGDEMMGDQPPMDHPGLNQDLGGMPQHLQMKPKPKHPMMGGMGHGMGMGQGMM